MRRGTNYNRRLAEPADRYGHLVLPSLQPRLKPDTCPMCPHPWDDHEPGIGCIAGWGEGATGCDCTEAP